MLKIRLSQPKSNNLKHNQNKGNKPNKPKKLKLNKDNNILNKVREIKKLARINKRDYKRPKSLLNKKLKRKEKRNKNYKRRARKNNKLLTQLFIMKIDLRLSINLKATHKLILILINSMLSIL